MKGITLTIVTPKIQSVNYGETIGNVSTLKKLTTGTDYPKKLITYFSDKALKYDLKRIGREQFKWNLMNSSITSIFLCNYNEDKNKKNKKVEFNYENFLKNMIASYEEFDLFGGMFADIGRIFGEDEKKIIEVEKLKRSQPVRFSNGYSISEFVYDMNLLNDIDAYNRYIQYVAKEKKQSLVYPEEHLSYYTYTLTIDLDKVGAIEKEDGGKVVFEPVVGPAVRTKRVSDILDIVLLYLNREIKGRKERLTPVFLIGGVYDVKHPFFANAIYFWEENQKVHFKSSDINKIFDMYSVLPSVKEETFLFYDESFVTVVGDLTISNSPLQDILKKMKKRVSEFYFNEYIDDLIKKVEQKGKDVSSFNLRWNEIKSDENNLEKEKIKLQKDIEILIDKRTNLVKDLLKEISE